MKKLITITLASLLAAVSLWGCNTANNADKLSDTTTSAEQPNTTDKLPSLTYHTDGIATGYINEISCFIAVEKWGEYFILPDNETIDQAWSETAFFGNTAYVFDLKTPTLVLYKLTRGNGNIEVYRNIYPDDVGYTEETHAFASFYDENNGVLFFWRDDSAPEGWPLSWILKTSDGGRTWVKQSVEKGSSSRRKECPNIAKFISKDIGIIGYRYSSVVDLCSRTYLTTDGGLTWNIISQLPYPEKLYNDIYEDYAYSEVVNFEKTDDGYLLSVTVNNGRTGSRDIIYFTSSDLKEWNFLS